MPNLRVPAEIVFELLAAKFRPLWRSVSHRLIKIETFHMPTYVGVSLIQIRFICVLILFYC